MPDFPYRSALIVGTGPGISASIARALASFGVKIALAARNVQKLETLLQATGAQAFAADAANPESVAQLFDQVTDRFGEPEIVVYNAGTRLQGPLGDLDPAAAWFTIRSAISAAACECRPRSRPPGAAAYARQRPAVRG